MIKENYKDTLWTVPGVYADAGDFPNEAIVREVWEETGYDVKTKINMDDFMKAVYFCHY